MSEHCSGREFVKALTEAGIIGPRVRRVVIEASIDHVLMIYVEHLGSKQIVEIVTPKQFEGAVLVESQVSAAPPEDHNVNEG